jgi:predicted O-methyltransferase YrrM
MSNYYLPSTSLDEVSPIPVVKLDGVALVKPNELEVLASLANSVKPLRRVVEIGANRGYTAATLLKTLPQITEWIAVDVLPGYRPDFDSQLCEILDEPGGYALGDPRYRLIRRKAGSFDVTYAELGYNIDFFFIDGDHGERAVAHDTDLARMTTRRNGMIVWHDYYYEKKPLGVNSVLDYLSLISCRNIRRVEGTSIAYERVT